MPKENGGGVDAVARDKKFACYHCKEWRKADWNFSPFINYINLSIYPSPCQCRCVYCDVRRWQWKEDNDAIVRETYKKIFETLRLAKNKKIIAPRGNATWQVSSGEITIHPFKKEILELVKGERVCFYTNGFIFDEDIARELHDNPMASINISIDSGTAETWHKVKGVNNFKKVLENLVLYRKYSNRPGQITVKYIILPQVNDFDKDFATCVNILKLLDVNSFSISRDKNVLRNLKVREQSSAGEILDDNTVTSAARLQAFCLLNKIYPAFDMNYTQKEINSVVELAYKEVLKIFSSK